jgi:hypothetical protein
MTLLSDPEKLSRTTFCVSLRSILKKWNNVLLLLAKQCKILFIELSGENLCLTISQVVTLWEPTDDQPYLLLE